ncbi:somatoliberin isoform X1 [Lepisosteus oculatus]|uniref:somatoliberin isoform X1 n=1 Tax=Lepisosteus oculatus TaxID=7918 RepID=UPI0035F51BC0
MVERSTLLVLCCLAMQAAGSSCLYPGLRFGQKSTSSSIPTSSSGENGSRLPTGTAQQRDGAEKREARGCHFHKQLQESFGTVICQEVSSDHHGKTAEPVGSRGGERSQTADERFYRHLPAGPYCHSTLQEAAGCGRPQNSWPDGALRTPRRPVRTTQQLLRF